MTSPRTRRWLVGARAVTVLALPSALGAQQPSSPVPTPTPVRDDAPRAERALSLDEAIQAAGGQSEAVRIADAAVLRARGQQTQARSLYLPQLNATVNYQRAIQNQFQEISEDADTEQQGPPAPPALCAPNIPENATPEQRAAALAQAQTCPDGGGFGSITQIFASPNTVTLGVTGSQTLFAGGRVVAQNRAASAGRRSAEVGVTSAQAQLRLDVTQAYFDAVLSDRLVTIAESSLVQTERTLRQTTLARQVGTTSEFELLRSRVARDNQRPQLIQARTGRDVAYVRLRQLLNVPFDEPLRLTTGIQETAPPEPRFTTASPDAPTTPSGVPVTPVNQVNVSEVLAEDPLVVAAVDSAVAAADTSADGRAPVRQASENVEAQRNLLRATRGQRLPALSLATNYQRFSYPADLGEGLQNFFPNWTVSLGLSVPLFTGGRIRGEEMEAEANLAEARDRLQQAREFAALDAQLAVAELEQAQATYAASVGTAGQAQRASTIAEVRFTEGLSTQVELSDARLLVQQAEVNRARAARDLQVARVRLALLRDLPISQQQGGTGGAGSASQQQFQQQGGQQQQVQPPGQGSAGGFTQTGSIGGGTNP